MDQQAIDIYECRFLKARSTQKDLPEGAGKSTCAGLDINRMQGQIAYYDREKQGYRVMECILPWKTWKLETLRDGQLLEDCLKGLVYYFADRKMGILDTIGLVVPYSFSAFQRSMIIKIAKNAGIQKVAMDSVGLYSCMAKHFFDETWSEDYLDIVCDFQEHSFEISMTEAADGVFESFGTVGITSKDGWSSLSAGSFEKTISAEINQYFRDLEFEKTQDGRLKHDSLDHRNFRFYMCGRQNDYIENVIKGLTGRSPEKSYGIPAFGGLIQGMKLQRDFSVHNILRLSTCNKNLWVGLGDNGEKEIVLERYTTTPIYKRVSLLLSTETRLRIYEGNYFNPAYDQQLLELELDGLKVEEGKEIEVELSIDTFGMIQVSVFNHENECIIDHYEL